MFLPCNMYLLFSGLACSSRCIHSALSLDLFGCGVYTFSLEAAGALSFHDPFEGTENRELRAAVEAIPVLCKSVLCLIRDLQHNPPTSMTALTILMGLLHFTERKRLPSGHFDTALIDQAGKRL